MTENENIEKLRALLLVEAKKSTLASRRVRKGSKTAQVRALYPDLQAIKKRSPYLTYADLTKMLQNIGLDVKVAVVQKAMQAEKAARPDAKRACKPANSSTERKAERQDGSAGKVHDDDRTAAKPEEATNVPATIPLRVPPRIDPNSFAGIRRRNMKI